jgi:hypothetical protein
MDEIGEVENNVIPHKLASIRLALEIGNMEDRVTKEVEIEHVKNKGDPLLSNEKLRKIAVKERLLLDPDYTEAVADKYAADEAVMYGEARLGSMKREFLIKYGPYSK